MRRPRTGRTAVAVASDPTTQGRSAMRADMAGIAVSDARYVEGVVGAHYESLCDRGATVACSTRHQELPIRLPIHQGRLGRTEAIQQTALWLPHDVPQLTSRELVRSPPPRGGGQGDVVDVVAERFRDA